MATAVYPGPVIKKQEVRVFPASEFVRGVAREWKAILERLAQNQSYQPSLAISGGNTPAPVYREFRRLDSENLLISRFRWFQTDERNVGQTHAQSNQAMINNALFRARAPSVGDRWFLGSLLSLRTMGPAVALWDRWFLGSLLSLRTMGPAVALWDRPEKNGMHLERIFFPVPVDVEKPEQTADAYEKILIREVGVLLPESPSPIAVFDLIILGLGEDGHTASLFPNGKWLATTQRNFLQFRVDTLNCWRFSLTWPVLLAAKRVIFWVSGKAKASVLAQILEGKARHVPAGRLAQERHVEWWIDSESKP